MYKLTAIVRHYKLEQIKNALSEAGFRGMTVEEVRGFGRQRGHREQYRGTEYTVDFVPKIKLDVVVNEADYRRAIDVISQNAHTGQVGDGKVFVSRLSNVVRIRTGESGPEAL